MRKGGVHLTKDRMYSLLAGKVVAIIATLATCAQSQDCVNCLTVPCQSPPPDANNPIWTSCFSCLQKGYPSQCRDVSVSSCTYALLAMGCNCSSIAGKLVQGLQPDVPPLCNAPPPAPSTPRPSIAAAPLPSTSSNGQPLQFIIPQMNFSCHGCLQTLNITLKEGVSAASIFYFQLWRRYTPISGQTSVVANELYQLNTNVPLTISTSSSNVYSLPLNVCFQEGDTIGIQLPYNSLLKIATDNSSVIYKREVPAQCSGVFSGIFQPSQNYTGSPIITLVTAPSFPSPTLYITTPSPLLASHYQSISYSPSPPSLTSPAAFTALTTITLSASLGAGVVMVTVLGVLVVCCCLHKAGKKNRAERMITLEQPVDQISGHNTSTQGTDRKGSIDSNNSYLSMQPAADGSPLELASWNQETHLSQSLPSTIDIAEEQHTDNRDTVESLENIDLPTGQPNMATFGSSIHDNGEPEGDNGLTGLDDQRGTEPQFQPTGIRNAYFVLESTKKDPRTGHNYHTLENQLSTSKACSQSEDIDQFWEPSSIESIFFDQMKAKKIREISNRDILIIQKLGSGEFGIVYKAQWHFQGGKQDVAVKTMAESGRPGAKVAFLQEAAIMGQFFHPNVVKMYGVVTKGKTAMIIYELMVNKDLSSYLSNHFMVPDSQPPPSGLLISCCRDVVCGMKYLSQKGFVHRDLAARNILVNDSMVCKIGDFGMSRRLEENYYITKKGKIALNWAPPEVFEYGKFSASSDVYSYGMLLHEIWSCGHRPMANYSPTEVRRLLSRGYCQPPPPLCPRKMYQLMVLCWNPDSKSRPTFQDIQFFLEDSDQTILSWSPEDIEIVENCMPHNGTRPAEVSELYRDLQQTYCLMDGTESPTSVGVMV